MNRLAVGALLVAILSSVGGCGPADDSSVPLYGTSYGPGEPGPYCSQYASCATCTPITGCGWCDNGDGTGSCAPGPDNCTTEWIWEPNFCGGPATSPPSSDASAGGPPDAAATDATPLDVATLYLTPAGDASSPSEGGEGPDHVGSDDSGSETDAALDATADQSASSTAPPIIADGGGCTPNDGSVCGSSQPYGVTCTQSSASAAVPEPPPSLECSVADVPTPAGTLYYCCSEPAAMATIYPLGPIP